MAGRLRRFGHWLPSYRERIVRRRRHPGVEWRERTVILRGAGGLGRAEVDDARIRDGIGGI
jgi:hypothetical protein